jgi:prepilin-type N-terminal cleavage/methylation domain-containing protein
MRTPPTTSGSGFTLIEVAIVATILSVIVAAVGVFELSSRKTLEQTSAIGSAQDLAHKSLERVLKELDGASIATLVPDPTGALGADDIVFQKSLGVNAAGAVVWSTRTRIALAPDDGETLDGVDNNRNGLTDERKLTVTYDYGTGTARTVTIAHRVCALFPGETLNGADDNGDGVIDEKGFNVRRVGNLLSLRMAASARGAGGTWVTWPESSTLRLRN